MRSITMPFRRRSVTLLVLVAALGSAAPAAADPCDTSYFFCDYDQDSTTPPVPASGRSIATVIDVRDTPEARALYDTLLPAPYTVPARPQVALQLMEAEFPSRTFDEVPLARFMEGPITLRAVRPNGEEGWFHISEPASPGFVYDSGRAVGLPKIQVTDLRFSQTAAGAEASATLGDRTISSLRWRPSQAQPTAAAKAWATLKDPFFSTLPALTDDATPYRTKFTAKPLVPTADVLNATPLAPATPYTSVPYVTALPDPQPGTVTYAVDPDVDTHDADPRNEPLPDRFPPGTSLADLIPTSGSVPGFFWDARPGFVLIQTDRTDR